MAPATAFPDELETDGKPSLARARALLAFGLSLTGGLFLAIFGVDLLDGQVEIGTGDRVRLGLAVLAALFGVILSVALSKDTDKAWRHAGAAKWFAILGSSFLGSSLSSVLIRNDWSWLNEAILVGALLVFAAAVVLAMRADARASGSENAN